MIDSFTKLINYARQIKPKRVGVVFPENEPTFRAIYECQNELGTNFILAGRKEVIERAIGEYGIKTNAVQVMDFGDPSASANALIKLGAEGKIDILLKGSIDTAALMRCVLQDGSGLRTGRLLSDVFVIEYVGESSSRLLMITDGGINPAPDLKGKVEIIKNAVEVSHALGNEMPKVAVISATEFINPDIRSTIDAAVLSKMNERRQIRGCIVDGPLALDNALDTAAAREKGIESPVAGMADILVAHDIETANSLAKSTTYFAKLTPAHVVVGGKIPILIPSRADTAEAKLLSVALGSIVSEYYFLRST
ncbi:MAG: bifunctional enoyl-CoA hydratase/phosphate acetyltransferase [Candidatus Kryptoniota bacterium]